jgi:hypothetical protein
MMTELKNEFSWSKTRDEVFKNCPRQYWFAYYGYWNGWLENAPERTRQIHILGSDCSFEEKMNDTQREPRAGQFNRVCPFMFLFRNI